MAEIKQWITVNGVHIPIMEGESKWSAVKKFIKNKKNERRTDLNDKKWKIAKKLDKAYSGMSSPSERHRLEKEYEENEEKLKKLNARKDIKGRAKTQYEIEDERFDRFADITHDVYNRMKYDNRNNPKRKSREDLLADARDVAHASSMYEVDYKYGKGGTKENKQVKIGDRISAARYKMSPRNSFSPKVSKALTKLDTNKGVRIDGMIWKKVGPDKFMNENGFKISKWDMANDISKAKKVIYYKKWMD